MDPTPERTVAALDDSELLEWFHDMVLIREFELRAEAISLRGKIPAGVHPAMGQEAVAVGVIRALRSDDVVTSTHRSHHHALAKGVDPAAIMAELYGMSTGVAGGRGGSMHLADFEKGLWGSNGIVGGGLGVAMGSAMGAAQLGLPRVSAGFFGDGGANTGRVWEFLNLASVWKLPLVGICENNLYAVETPSATVTGGVNVARRAEGFGLPAEQIDGQDVVAVFEAAARAVDHARAGNGAYFLELLTYRFVGHSAGDPTAYRSDEEVAEVKANRDPIEVFAAYLTKRGALDAVRRAEIEQRVAEIVAHSEKFAEESECSDPSTAGDNVSVWNNWTGSSNR